MELNWASVMPKASTVFFFIIITKPVRFYHRINGEKTHKHTKESKHTHYLVFLVSRGTNTAIL